MADWESETLAERRGRRGLVRRLGHQQPQRGAGDAGAPPPPMSPAPPWPRPSRPRTTAHRLPLMPERRRGARAGRPVGRRLPPAAQRGRRAPGHRGPRGVALRHRHPAGRAAHRRSRPVRRRPLHLRPARAGLRRRRGPDARRPQAPRSTGPARVVGSTSGCTSSDDILRVSEATALPRRRRRPAAASSPACCPRSRPASATTTDRRRGHSLPRPWLPPFTPPTSWWSGRPGGLGSGHHAGALGPRRDRRRQGRRSPATRSAATGSPPRALRELEHLGLDPGDRRRRGSTSTTCVVRSPSGHQVTLPAAPRTAAATARSPAAATSTPHWSTWPARPAPTVRRGRTPCAGAPSRTADGVDGRRSTGSAPCGRAGRSAPTACGRRCARRSGSAEPGYRGEWHAFRQYLADVVARGGERAVRVVRARPAARLRLVVPARAAAWPTSASASCAAAPATRSPDMRQLWPELLARPHIRALPRARRPAPRRPTGRGRSRPGSTGSCSAPARTLFVGRRRRRHRPDDRRGHRPGPRHRHAGPPRRSSRAGDRRPAAPRPPTSTRCAATWSADHRIADAARPASCAHRSGARAAVRVAGATDWTRRNFARWLFEDYPAPGATPALARTLRDRPWHRAGMSSTAGPRRLPFEVMRTRLTDILEIEHPVMLAGMGGVSLPPARRRGLRGRRLRLHSAPRR